MTWKPPSDEELREGGPPVEFDNSGLVDSERCKLYYYWTLRGYTWETKPNYFSWGTAWHECLRHWYLSGVPFREASPEERQEAGLEALVKGLSVWQMSGSEEDSIHNMEKMRKLFTKYINYYRREPWETIPRGDEAGWLWPLAGTPYYLGGKVDEYVKWKDYGFGVIEHKTEGGYLTKNYVESWQFSTQVTQYAWYMEQLHPGESFGVIINAATKQMPGPRSNWTTNQFERVLEQRSPLELDKFIEDTVWRIGTIEICWDRWYWPRTSHKGFCTGMPGISSCPFRQPCKACAQGADFRTLDLTTFLGISLREERWEPWVHKEANDDESEGRASEDRSAKESAA
jgi:hypothetical protein